MARASDLHGKFGTEVPMNIYYKGHYFEYNSSGLTPRGNVTKETIRAFKTFRWSGRD